MRPSWRDARKVRYTMKDKSKFGNEHLVKVWLKTLPWLSTHFCTSAVKKITVRQFDYDVLRRSIRGSDSTYSSKILLLDQDGVRIGQVGKEFILAKTVQFERGFGWLKFKSEKEIANHYKFFEETVEDAIRRLEGTGGPDDQGISFIIGEFWDEHEADGSTGNRLVISKIPEKHDLRTWLKELQNLETIKLQEAQKEVARSLEKLRVGDLSN